MFKKQIKRLAKAVLPQRSRPYLWLYHHLYRPARFPSLNHLIALFARQKTEVFFLMIGAHEGLPADIVYRYIHLNRWAGILVEPQPQAFQQLQQCFRNCPQLVFENTAVSSESGQRPFYSLQGEEGKLPIWANQLSSFHPNVPQTVLKDHPDLSLASQPINCTTINDLLEKHQVKELSFLMIDTEGHDFEIFKVLDFQRWLPELIVYEHCHLSEEDQQAAIQLLKKEGYFVYPTAFNTVAFRKERIAKHYVDYLV